MCIKVPLHKYKVKYCDVLNKTIRYFGNPQIGNFCLPSGDDTWFGPEYDTENHSHMVPYADNETKDNEVRLYAYNLKIRLR